MNADKEPSIKMKDTLKIQFTCMLIDDNNKKLNSIEKLNACVDKTSNFLFDDDVKKDALNILNEVSIDIKKSHESCKNEFSSVNPEAKQVEEAYHRMNKDIDEENIDAALALYDLYHEKDDDTKTIRITIPNDNPNPNSRKPIEIPKCLVVPAPKYGDVYSPTEVWDIFNTLKNQHGKSTIKKLNNTLMKHFTRSDNGKPLIPVRVRAACRLTNKERKNANRDWDKKGRKRLSPLKDVTNVVHKRAKRDSALEINASEVKLVVKNKIKDDIDLNNHEDSTRTI